MCLVGEAARTQVAIMTTDHDETLPEATIEEILFHFPYRIDDRLKPSYVEERQVIFDDGTRADLRIESPTDIFVVEIKKGMLDLGTFYQLTHYINEIYLKVGDSKGIIGIMVGLEISDPSTIKEKISKYRYEIRVKLLGRDIPTKLKFCTKCRKANAISRKECWYDGHTVFFR